MVIKKSYRTIPWRLPTKMLETVENMRGALGSVQRSGTKIRGGAVGASALKKRSAWNTVGGNLCMMGWACFRDKWSMVL